MTYGRSFSQRNGFIPTPPQLALGQLSREIRIVIWDAILTDLQNSVGSNYTDSWLIDPWAKILRDHYVKVDHQLPEDFSIDHVQYHSLKLKSIIIDSEFHDVFDLMEFLLAHPLAKQSLKKELEAALANSRAAYRILDGRTVSAVGSEEQAAVIERAVAQTAGTADQARHHLINSSVALRNGDWPSSVRESIHAVESVAVHASAIKRYTRSCALSFGAIRPYTRWPEAGVQSIVWLCERRRGHPACTGF